MIVLRKRDYDAIVEYGKKGLPNEVCGLLGGFLERESISQVNKTPIGESTKAELIPEREKISEKSTLNGEKSREGEIIPDGEGTTEGEIRKVEKVYYLTNTDASPEHFSMDLAEQLAAVRDMRKQGYVLLGNFHSHPETPSRPSEEDKRLAHDPRISYLILSLANHEKPVLKAFNIADHRFVSEEEIVVHEF